jgi:23S rRNA (uracil1939-C5)-methyltransferase
LPVTAESPAYGGLSIARPEGAVLFIKGAIPGETVEIRVDEQKKDYSFCTATDILSPSRDRVKPSCEHFGVCGGCQLQYIDYPRQVTLKEEIILDCVRRLAKTDLPLSPALFSSTPWAYRRRGQFKISGPSIGFFREKTRDVVDIDKCPLMVREINDLLSGVSILLKSDKRIFQGISELHITYGDNGIALMKTGAKIAGKPELTELLPRLMDIGFKGVCVEFENRKPEYTGSHHTTFDLNGLKYGVSQQTFFQSHWELNCRLVKLVSEGLQPLAGKMIIDLYSGAGNFTLPLAHGAQEVIAVEESAAAIEDGKRNAKLNNIVNCRFIKSTAERFNEKAPPGVLILDPPRSGLTKNVMNKVLELEAESIVYISCNPSTFARDLKTLLAKYEPESLRLVDFFPQTYHIESVGFFRLR